MHKLSNTMFHPSMILFFYVSHNMIVWCAYCYKLHIDALLIMKWFELISQLIIPSTSIFKTLILLSFTFLIYCLRALIFSRASSSIFKKKTKSLWKTWLCLCKNNLEPSSKECVNSPHKLKCNNLFLWIVWWTLPCGMCHNGMYAIIIIKSSYQWNVWNPWRIFNFDIAIFFGKLCALVPYMPHFNFWHCFSQ
jgi:hypothetical protein